MYMVDGESGHYQSTNQMEKNMNTTVLYRKIGHDQAHRVDIRSEEVSVIAEHLAPVCELCTFQSHAIADQYHGMFAGAKGPLAGCDNP